MGRLCHREALRGKIMKVYTHSNGSKSIFPEHIPAGWEVMFKPDTFQVVWRRTNSILKQSTISVH
jgi:hypothetical protein